jgi:PadR family transcriptional regulator, regulatory protein PadR
MRTSARLKGNLDLLVLAVLYQAPAHGYAIIERLRERSDGTFDLPEGTVYPALHQLEESGSVTSWWDTSGPRRRRVYALTPSGEAQLSAERTHWKSFTASVQSVIGALA